VNISEANDVAKVLRALLGHPDPGVDLDPIVQRLAERAAKPLLMSPESILRGLR
jgi:hypothetical protein